MAYQRRFLSAATLSLGTAEIVPFLKPEPPRCRSFGCNVVLDGL